MYTIMDGSRVVSIEETEQEAVRKFWLLNAYEVAHGRPARYTINPPASGDVPENLPTWAREALKSRSEVKIRHVRSLIPLPSVPKGSRGLVVSWDSDSDMGMVLFEVEGRAGSLQLVIREELTWE